MFSLSPCCECRPSKLIAELAQQGARAASELPALANRHGSLPRLDTLTPWWLIDEILLSQPLLAADQHCSLECGSGAMLLQS